MAAKKNNEWPNKTERLAHCLTCGKKWYTPNAHGVGAKHARKYKHNVVTEIIFSYCYFYAMDKGE